MAVNIREIRGGQRVETKFTGPVLSHKALKVITSDKIENVFDSPARHQYFDGMVTIGHIFTLTEEDSISLARRLKDLTFMSGDTDRKSLQDAALEVMQKEYGMNAEGRPEADFGEGESDREVLLYDTNREGLQFRRTIEWIRHGGQRTMRKVKWEAVYRSTTEQAV